MIGYGLMRPAAEEHRRDRPQDDLDVAPERPAVDVLEVELHPLVEVDLAAAAHLPGAGDPGPHREAAALPALVLIDLGRQRRIGLNGREFTLYKFRSMVQDAEAQLGQLLALNEMKVGPVFKVKNDPRVTAVGRWLRKTSLDEFPQFWNVLRGEMSIVGPRPPIPAEVQKYERWQRRRLSMKPGITCIWQVSGRSELGFDQWMELDLEYIDNWSLWHDLKILAKTVPAVLTGRGAH